MTFIAGGTVTIVVMFLLFASVVIDQIPKTNIGYLKYTLIGLYAVYLAVEYVGVFA